MDAGLLQSAIYFLRDYADRCHHGKEEGILFRRLALRDIPREQAALLAELSDEHAAARRIVRSLAGALDNLAAGAPGSREQVIDGLRAVTDLYPRHIAKEDRQFFIPVMQLFSPAERDEMLIEGLESDSQLLQELHRQVVGELETRRRQS